MFLNQIFCLWQMIFKQKDLNNQDNIKDFVNKISKLTNKQVRPEQMNKIINIIQNNQVPTDIDKFM